MNAKRESKLNPAIAGRTPLMHAAFEGDLPKAVALLQQGSDVNARDADGDTALMFASFNGHFLLVKLLLGHGADVFLRARNGWTAKQAAMSKNHRDIGALIDRAEERALAGVLPRLDDEFSAENDA